MLTVALIAHDGKKNDMIELVTRHQSLLERCTLVATGTTGGRIREATGLDVQATLSGPLGGDAQIAAMVAEGNVDLLIFLVDPLYAHPHEPDIQGLQRVCNVYNIPFATNTTSAGILITGMLHNG